MQLLLGPIEPGREIYAYVTKLENGVETDIWDDVNEAWVPGWTLPVTTPYKVSLAAGLHQEQSKYAGSTAFNLAGYSGRVMVNYVDDSLVNPHVITQDEKLLINGEEFHEAAAQDLALVHVGIEPNKAQTVVIFLRHTTDNRPATGNVLTTEIGPAAAVPVLTATASPATYSGTPGVYLVDLTASETNSPDPLLLRVTSSDAGAGDAVLMPGTRDIEDDWASGGTLESTLTTAAGQVLTLFSVSVPGLSSAIAALPTAAANADAVWDEAIAGHVAGGSAGELVERLDLLAAGGAGQLTGTRAAKLDFLDVSVLSRADENDVAVGCQLAIENNHLDHLLAQDYNPAAKPGVATALLNELIVNDGGVSQLSANALELAPTGGGGGVTAAAIRAEIDSNSTQLAAIVSDTNELQTDWAIGGRLDAILGARSSHTPAGVRAEIDTNSTQLAAIVSDTNELQTDWANGGRLNLILDAIKVDSSAILVDTDAVDLTLKSGGAVFTLIAAATPALIRAEIDTNSTQLAAIVSDTNELQADWVDGGRLDLILDSRSSHTPAGVRAEIDTNSTQLAAIVSDTNELQTDWVDGGRLDLILDAVKADSAAILVDTDAVDLTLKSGGTIHTMVSAISVSPNVLSAEFVNPARTWVASKEKIEARNRLALSAGDQVTLAMDFGPVLNQDTSVNTPGGAVQVAGDMDLTIADVEVAQDRRNVHARVTGQQAGKRYTIRYSAVTTDGETISSDGVLVVNP